MKGREVGGNQNRASPGQSGLVTVTYWLDRGRLREGFLNFHIGRPVICMKEGSKPGLLVQEIGTMMVRLVEMKEQGVCTCVRPGSEEKIHGWHSKG